MNDHLADQFNGWLERHYGLRKRDPIRDHADRLDLLLGGSFRASSLQAVRLGRPTSYRVRAAVRELVELDEPEKVLALRRDQILERELRYGLSFQEQFDKAPDGGDLREWSRTVKARLDRTHQTDAPVRGEALRLWGQIHKTTPANARRRQRLFRPTTTGRQAARSR